MGRLTLTDFRSRLQRSLGNRGFDGSDLDDWINDGLYELTGAVEFRRFLTTSTATINEGDDDIEDPTDMLAPKALRVDEEHRLVYTEPEHFLQKDPEEEGVPELYTWDDGGLRFWPTADDTYTLRLIYLKEPEALDNPGDKTVLPAQWDRAILMFATAAAHEELGEFARANDWLRRASSYARSRITDEDWAGDQTPARGLGIARSESDLRDLET